MCSAIAFLLESAGTRMYDKSMILCGSNAYEKKYYLDDNFTGLPLCIQNELKIMCVLYTEDIGGILTLEFNEEGNLLLQVSSEEGDLLFDDIGSVLKIKQLQVEKRELLESLEMYYKVFFLHEDGTKLFEEDLEV
jgi:hypothetical protein